MSGVFIKGLHIEPCDDGFDGKGLVIVGYDDKLYSVAHKDIIPVETREDALKILEDVGKEMRWTDGNGN